MVYVVVDQPKVKDQTANGIASALAKKVAENVFKVLGIYPEKTKE